MPSLQSDVMLILSHPHKGFDQEAVPIFVAQEERRLGYVTGKHGIVQRKDLNEL